MRLDETVKMKAGVLHATSARWRRDYKVFFALPTLISSIPGSFVPRETKSRREPGQQETSDEGNADTDQPVSPMQA